MAWRWFKKGILPVPATQLPTGTILVEEAQVLPETAAIYARVPSADQRGDLDCQVARALAHLSKQQVPVTKSLTEVGSGQNGQRPKLLQLLADKTVTVIAVEHSDRLMRFGTVVGPTNWPTCTSGVTFSAT